MQNYAFTLPLSSDVPKMTNSNCKPKLNEFPESTSHNRTYTNITCWVHSLTTRLHLAYSLLTRFSPAHNLSIGLLLAHSLLTRFPFAHSLPIGLPWPTVSWLDCPEYVGLQQKVVSPQPTHMMSKYPIDKHITNKYI